jgi:hypothetical protein
MRPIPIVVFKKQGSQDDSAIAIKGDEIWRTLAYFRHRWAIGL